MFLSDGTGNLNYQILILQFATLAATVVGWLFTAARQAAILRVTHEYQRKDRELAVHRARMDRATNVTKTIIEASDHWFKLASLAMATRDNGQASEFQQFAGPLLRDVTISKLNLAVILYDPQFRALRKLLDPNANMKISDSLIATEKASRVFFNRYYHMQPTDPDIDKQVQNVLDDSRDIADKLVEAASAIADSFATLDQHLAESS